MGLNAFFTYTVVLHMGHSWQVALGAVFISATMFFLLSIFRIREWIINSIPLPLRSAIAAGIGLFLAPVSYTHLDVYKRQLLACVTTTRAWSRTSPTSSCAP